MGSGLTEVEIFDCMIDSLRASIQACTDLAVKPLKGHSYRKLQEHLPLIEGCCRQVSVWREDTSWLILGMKIAEVHRRAGDWLRGIRDPETGRYRQISEGVRHPMFMKLAELLRSMLNSAQTHRTRATRTMGPILPTPLSGPHRQVRDNYAVHLPPGMVRRESGLIISGDAA